MKLEVIAKNLKDISTINRSAADRIEFCRNLPVGGLTPKRWVIWLAAKIAKVPINVMLRPTSDSFNYSDKDFQRMLKDAAFIARTKVNGVVFGILNEQKEIDVARMQQIVALLPNKQKVFHKAFDELDDLPKGLQILADLGVDAVLTAGGADINANLLTLAQLTATKKLTIIGGGGVTFANAPAVAAVVDDVHVGTAVRINNSWTKKINQVKITELNEMIKK